MTLSHYVSISWLRCILSASCRPKYSHFVDLFHRRYRCDGRQWPEIDDYHAHVVTAFAHRAVDVRAQAYLQEAFTDLADFSFPFHLQVHKVNCLLVSVALPDTVTPHDHKVALRVQFLHLDVREGSNRLLFQ